MPEATPPLLFDLSDVHYTYMENTPFAKKALNGVNLKVRAGESIGIVGATGSGKSTLIQHLNGLLRAQSGQVCVDGCVIPCASSSVSSRGWHKIKQRLGWLVGRDGDAVHADLVQVRFEVGLLFQFPEQQLFEESVARDVAFGPQNMHLEVQEVDERVHESMDLVGLDYETYAERSPFSLSGGEKRRAALAGVLALRPKCLVLDEPTAGLDPEASRRMLDLLRRLRSQRALTLIVVSHRFDELALLVDRLVIMSQGQVVADGPTRHILHDPQLLKEHGLEPPALSELCALFPSAVRRSLEQGEGMPLTVDETEKAVIPLLTGAEPNL